LSQQSKIANLDPEAALIYQKEVQAYEEADVVLTITADDKEKMLMTLDQQFDLLFRLASNETVSLCPAPLSLPPSLKSL
jgi:hypothetical protein